MSAEAAIKAGQALSSTEVQTFGGGFQMEELELLPREVDILVADVEEVDEEDAA